MPAVSVGSPNPRCPASMPSAPSHPRSRRSEGSFRSSRSGCAGKGRGDEGLAFDALQEGVEGVLLGAIVGGTPLPGPSDLGVDPEPYLLGLGDVVGEVRRLVLDRLAHDDLAGAEVRLALMDALARDLMRFDTTRAIVQLKPKQDTARSLLERTRGEVVMARLHLRAHVPSAAAPREGR